MTAGRAGAGHAPQIRVVNRQRALRIRISALRALAGRMLGPPPRGREAWSGLEVILLGDRGIRTVHREVFGDNSPTDVITQPYRPMPPGSGWSGEIYVNAQRATEEGRRRPGGPARELALYVIHGCLHLGGETDATPAGRARMRRLERARLRTAGREGLLRNLIRTGHD